MTIRLTGDSNDYFGKGLSGGKLVLRKAGNSPIDPGSNIIVGNVALYGATSGEAYIGGIAGERFCVRNSGAEAVVEGVGDHGCEYMTGGYAVILGPVGKNFAAGMSGGTAFVLDSRHDLYRKINKELILMRPVQDKEDEEKLKALITNHVRETGSPRGKEILDNWENSILLFKKVIPADYSRMLTAIRRLEDRGASREQAELEAFYTVQKGMG
jgi:glutamate synthase (ferredoxin)